MAAPVALTKHFDGSVLKQLEDGTFVISDSLDAAAGESIPEKQRVQKQLPPNSPTFTSVTPNSTAQVNGVELVFIGTKFTNVDEVYFRDPDAGTVHAAGPVEHISPTEIRCTQDFAPEFNPFSTGTLDIGFRDAAGSNLLLVSDHFTLTG